MSLAHSSRDFGSSCSMSVSLAMSRSACFTNQDTMPGLAPQQFTAVGSPGDFRRASRMFSRSM
jgi:hypothetical protein